MNKYSITLMLLVVLVLSSCFSEHRSLILDSGNRALDDDSCIREIYEILRCDPRIKESNVYVSKVLVYTDSFEARKYYWMLDSSPSSWGDSKKELPLLKNEICFGEKVEGLYEKVKPDFPEYAEGVEVFMEIVVAVENPESGKVFPYLIIIPFFGE